MATGIGSPLALGGLYPSVDGRYVAANGKPFTSVSDAESALNGFPSKLSESCVGLTVLVADENDPDYPKAKEYWVQPKGTTPETYGLVVKGAGVTDYAELENKPTINNVPLSGNKTASDLRLATAEQGGKADTAIQGVSVNGTEVTPDPTTKKVALTIENGKSAYQLYLGNYEDEHGSTDGALDEAAWLESLQGKSALQIYNETMNTSLDKAGFINVLKQNYPMEYVGYNQTAAEQSIGTAFAAIDQLSASASTAGKLYLMPNDGTTPTGTELFITVQTDATTYMWYRLGALSVPSNVLTEDKIVQNLNTGGADKVLSAAAGKTLADCLVEVVEDDISLTTTADASTEDSACYTGRLIYRNTTPSSADGSGAGWYENHTVKAIGTANTFADATGGGASCTCIVINVGGKLNEKVVLEPSETNTVTGQAIFLSEALKRGNSTYAYRKNEIIGEPIELPAGVRKEIAVPYGAKYLYVLRSVKLYESSSSTTVVATNTCYFKTGTTKRIYGEITNVSERISNIETEIEPIRTIEEAISELPELKRKVEYHEDWLTKKVTKVQLNEGTLKRGWFGFNGSNWLWYRTGNANNGVITARIFELGENKAIDTGKYDKITIQATNEEVGYIKYRPTVTNAWESVGTAYTFLKELITFPSSNANASLTTSDFCNGYAPGTTYSERPYKKIAAEGEKEVTIPEDAKYLVVLTVKCNQQVETAATMKGVSCGTQILLEDVVEPTQGFPTFSAEIINRLDNIANELDSDTTIFHFNPIKEVGHKIHQAKMQSGFELATANRAPVYGYTFMHVSDCHGGSEKESSKEQWGKLMEYAKTLRDAELIDDVVDTGDVIEARFSQFNGNSGRTISDWRTDDYGETQKVLTVIGNHDTRGPSSTDTQDNWRDNIGKNVYDVLMADIDEWGVEQPEDAAENGLCYYYKDYMRTVAGTTYTLRALFLDMMGWGYKRVNGEEVSDNSQREWVWGVLSTARENNMMVVVFCHEIPAEFTSIRSSMSSKYASKLNSGGTNLSSYNPKFKELAYLIHYHMVLGGRFAGYVCGHSHTTFVGKISGSVTVDTGVETLVNTGLETPVANSVTVNFDTWGDYYPQRACVVDTTQVGLYRQNTVVTMHDGVRIKETDSEHSFWIVNISTGGVISLVKIGFHLNKYFQKRDVLRIVGRVYGYFSASTEYSAGSIVSYTDNKYYKITAKHSQNTTWANTSKTEYPFIFDGNFEYAAGNIVSKDGNLWRFLSPAVSGGTTDWAASDKELYSMVSE